MGRKKLLTDEQIQEAKIRVDNKEISLRGIAGELGVSHVALNLRFKQLGKNGKQKLLTTTKDKLTIDKLNNRLGRYDGLEEIKKSPFRKIPTAKEYSGHDFYQLDIEQLRMFYRLLTGRVDKSKGGKASNIKSLILAIIEGLQYNLKQYIKQREVD